ncbi:Unknown protein, partial [Striga hermonthica]
EPSPPFQSPPTFSRPSPRVVDHASPLSPDILQESVPKKIKVPQLGLYDGSSDPDSHIGLYTSWMDLHGATNALRCRMFSLTLGPKAQRWYHSLYPHSISTWGQLRAAFRSHFIGSQINLAPKESIANIVQGEDESLKDYIARFNDRVQNMEQCHPEALLISAQAGLKPKTLFKWSLCQNKPTTYQEFLVRAQNYIMAEESSSIPVLDIAPNKGKAKDEKSGKSSKSFAEIRALRRQKAEELKENYQGVFSVGAAAVYEEIKTKGLLPDPKPIFTDKDKVDKSRYCTYHKAHGHNTDQCRNLISALLKLIEDPNVKRFTHSGDKRKKGGRFEDGLDSEDDADVNPRRKKPQQGGPNEILTFYPAHQSEAGTSRGQKRDRPPPSEAGRAYTPPRRVNTSRAKSLSSKRQAKAYARRAYHAGQRLMHAGSRPAPEPTPNKISFTDEDAFLFDHPHSDALLQIGSRLPEPLKTELIKFLRENADVFAWTHEDMVGIDPKVACHRLQVDPTVKPVVQKRRKLGPDRQQALEEEVVKLKDNEYIREVRYPTWVANPVLVKKSNGAWRLCIEFSDLNKACPKDSYPLPHIDYMVDATSGHELMSFMDAYSGYNQIPMHPDDEEHTSFYSARGLYCYTMMPFGLKNAGATYQRLVNKMFASLIGVSMEVYVDDMLVKSVYASDHVNDLNKMFSILRDYSMKLNPKKCTFGVGSGKFLGYIVSQRGIDANPEKIRAIQDLRPPTSIKGVQSLTGKLAALSRFISKSTDRCKPFFDAIKKNHKFEWTPDCQRALEAIKETLGRAPTMQKPRPGETLYLYLGVSEVAVSAALVREEDSGQHPIYYVSKALHDAELRYSPMEKLAFALVTAARKLRPYFLEFSIAVLTSYPIRQILHRPDTSGRMVKWAVELGQYDIHYRPRTAMKGQVLSDFIAEFTPRIEEAKTEEPWV